MLFILTKHNSVFKLKQRMPANIVQHKFGVLVLAVGREILFYFIDCRLVKTLCGYVLSVLVLYLQVVDDPLLNLVNWELSHIG